MDFEVEMLAFGDPNEIRLVEVPWNRLSEEDVLENRISTEEALQIIWRFGQNDVQPKQHPSLSVGDVIRFKLSDRNERYRIEPIGFQKI